MRLDQRAPRPLTLLGSAFGDSPMQQIWAFASTTRGWLAFESALAECQAQRGIIPRDAADEIRQACATLQCDEVLLWQRTRVVGYPILPLLEQLGAHGGERVAAFAHWGATTQDVMDTGMALQSRASLARLGELLNQLGDALADLAETHLGSLMPARTHAQYAVPTTFGAKVAAFLDELRRHRTRMAELAPRLCRVSMFGAGGTSAAYGPQATGLRQDLAAWLGLENASVSWHSARDAQAEAVFLCAAIGATCARFGREVIELSRPEISEVREGGGHLRGASSTMPQKSNPISSEMLVGFGIWSGAVAAAPAGFMLAGHERAAGEWHAEGEALTSAFCSAAASLAHAVDLASHLDVDIDRMAAHARDPQALLMAESAMMQLAPGLGRARAHEVVYDACVEVRRTGRDLDDSLTTGADTGSLLDMDPQSYLGDAAQQAMSAVNAWREGKQR